MANDIFEWLKNGKITDLPDLIINKYQKQLDEEDILHIDNRLLIVPDYHEKTYFSSDTIPSRRHPGLYLLSGSINLKDNDIRFGVHNTWRENVPQYDQNGNLIPEDESEEYSYRLVKTPGLILTTFKNWIPWEPGMTSQLDAAHFRLIGIDKYGKFKNENFEKGDMVSVTPYVPNVKGIKLDTSSNSSKFHYYKLDVDKPDELSWLNFYRYANHPGNTSLLTTDYASNVYNDVAGGGVIIRAGDEIRLVLGSANQINEEIQKLKKQHNTPTVDIYKLDLGSYSHGLRTYNQIITPKQWKLYRKLNVAGGHGAYLLTPEDVKKMQQKENQDIRLAKYNNAKLDLRKMDILMNNLLFNNNNFNYSIFNSTPNYKLPEFNSWIFTYPTILEHPEYDLQEYTVLNAPLDITVDTGQSIKKGLYFMARNINGKRKYEIWNNKYDSPIGKNKLKNQLLSRTKTNVSDYSKDLNETINDVNNRIQNIHFKMMQKNIRRKEHSRHLKRRRRR